VSHRAGWVKGRSSAGSDSAAEAAEAAANTQPLPGYGGSLHLLTDLPPTRPATEVLMMQGGGCAGCRAPLPPAAGGTRLLSGASKVNS